MKTISMIILSVLIFTSCSNDKTAKSSSVNDSTLVTAEVNKDSLLLDLNKQVLAALKAKDYKKLVEFIHPTLGVRFSAYATIDTTIDVSLSADKFVAQMSDKAKLNWGNYDGSGEPIKLTAEQYFKKFVYSADFVNAEKTSLNQILGKGNSLNNMDVVYKDCDFVENYFSGFDKQYEGIDWCSLKLVFEKYQDKYFLIAIVHDQWTV